MATIERQAPVVPSAAPDDQIFSADDGRRERALRIVGPLVALVAGIWLLALFAGALGFGHLPGVPGSGLLDRTARSAKAPVRAPQANRSTAGTQSLAAQTGVARTVNGQGQAGSVKVP